jgi:hypothetical protein
VERKQFHGQIDAVGGVVAADFGAAATLLRSDEPGAKLAVARLTRLSLSMANGTEEEEIRRCFPGQCMTMRHSIIIRH